MVINVGAALDSHTAVIVSVERETPGGYVDGIWQPGVKTVFKCLASPQQPTPQDLLNLPEGQRQQNVYLFICNKLINVADEKTGASADIITFKGAKFKAIKVADWIIYGHNFVYAIRQ